MISVVVAHVPFSQEAERMLDTCLSSIKGQYDELIMVVNDGIGYGASFNRGFKYANEEYICLVSNDTELIEGDLYDLIVPGVVTTPLVNEETTQFGCFCCIPRSIYEKYGLFDESFKGAYWEDEDLLRRWKDNGVELRRIDTVRVRHEGGATVKAIMDEGECYRSNKAVYDKKYNL